MMNRRNDRSLLTDLSLLGVLLLFVVTTLYMTLTAENVLLNAMYLGIAALLVIATYFTGLTTGLVLNLIFIFVQGTYMLYTAVALQQAVEFQLVFWLLMPLLLSISVYALTVNQQLLQQENSVLQREKRQLSILDETTHLRTLTAYLEDTAVYMDTAKRYELPLITITLQFRYFDQLQRLMTADQLHDLILATSEILKHSTRGEDIVYILDSDNLTWGILLYTNTAGGRIVRDRIDRHFEEEIGKQATLQQFDIQLRAGIAEYDQTKMKNARDLMDQAEKESNYDV
ncbi:diguanylate cyclase domain-containing protein [Lapidilactobacillus luobeiensis]|uniref:diguanylate cyclase domain-containing protein n=1 Tax=Lapidilactobacillus luobeiensis TaxID=2950371 RepID=UPI0021C45544|nr:diguanylate cyclase [Lapidilactobacillus luobeiensis]